MEWTPGHWDELRRPAQSLGKAPKPGLKPCQKMSKVLENGTKMTGALFYKILEIDLQAQASGPSLLASDKSPRTENQIKKRAQALSRAQWPHSTE